VKFNEKAIAQMGVHSVLLAHQHRTGFDQQYIVAGRRPLCGGIGDLRFNDHHFQLGPQHEAAGSDHGHAQAALAPICAGTL
jgi:hypothetical protein